jgi:DNA-binding LacI/PurR family transcriptional regulator
MIKLGHREVVHLAGPLDWLEARGRHRAWRDELSSAGLDEPELVVGDRTSDFAYEMARNPARLPDCTAIFAGNDQMALGLCHGFAERGVAVPGDVSVVGSDDLPEARHFLPPLTTVQDFRALGERSLAMLLDALGGRTRERRSLIEPQLVVRESATAAPVNRSAN